MTKVNEKQIYKLRKNVYTYGRPGEYAPRIERIPHPGGKGGRPSYRRIRGGTVPGDLQPEQTVAVALLAALTAADKVAEA